MRSLTMAPSRTVRIAAALAAAALAAHLAAAGEPSRVLTLDQCLSLAARNSPILRAADNAVTSAELSRRELAGTRRPQVRLNGVASASPTFGRYGYDPAITDYGQLSAQIIAEQKLYDGGVYGLRAKQLRLEAQSTGLARRIAERDIASDVRLAYVEILRAREEAALRREGLSRLEDYLAYVKNLNASGRVHVTDVLKTEIEVSAEREALRTSVEALALAKYDLSALIDAAPDTSFDVAGTIETLSFGPIDTAAAGAPSLESDKYTLDVAKSSLEADIVRREKFPTLSLVADAGLLSSLEPPESEHGRRLGYGAGISLDLPLVDWGGRRLRERQQRLAAENARYEAAAFERTQSTELRALILRMENLERHARAVGATVREADDNYTLTKSKYIGGAAPVTEVLAAHQLATGIRIEELGARSDILKVSARIARILSR